MIKIKDAVDGVIDAMRLRGCSDYTLKEIRWSVYTPIVRYHCDNGTEVCSDELLEEICRKQEERYTHGEISRKYYRSFVTAAFRIRSSTVQYSQLKADDVIESGVEIISDSGGTIFTIQIGSNSTTVTTT